MTPYYSDDLVTIYHGDCRDVLPHVRADALVTDPPYGIEAAKANAHSSIRDNPRWPTQRWDDERQVDALGAAVAMCGDAAVWGGNYYADILRRRRGGLHGLSRRPRRVSHLLTWNCVGRIVQLLPECVARRAVMVSCIRPRSRSK